MRRLVVGVGEWAIAGEPGDLIVTHALGSCVAVCVFDAHAGVAGMLHFMLPDSRINAERGRQQPAAFADTGIPLFLEDAARNGLRKARTVVKLVGGAEIAGVGQASFKTGLRNVLAAKQVLWRAGLLVNAEDTGGNIARTVRLAAHDGLVQIVSGSGDITEI